MFFNLLNRQPKIQTDLSAYRSQISPVVLLIIDGFGIAPPSEGNAVTRANTPNYDKFMQLYPSGQLFASGEAVGLTANEEGNSEVGHLTIGAGRVVPQSLVRINKAIADGSFFENDAFEQACKHARLNGSALHLVGLVGSGEVHSSIKHFFALLDYVKRKSLPRVYLHLFTDGRDSPPKEAQGIMQKIENDIKDYPNIQIATVAGRYYSMDRDQRWERTQKVYDAMTLGQGIAASSAVAAVEQAYAQGKTDEFIPPTVISRTGMVKDNDAVIFFNFRIDRPRQLTMAFTIKNFESLQGFELETQQKQMEHEAHAGETEAVRHTFKRQKILNNLFFVTMTQYQKNIPVSAVAYPPITVEESLPELVSRAGLKQLHLAESEKERMVTYYMDGMRDTSFPNEDVVIVPSPKVPTYDKKPEMSTFEIVREVSKGLKQQKYHLLILNFACTDMVAHTGKMKPSIQAVEAADQGMGMIAQMCLSLGGTLVVTADHGNVEELIRYDNQGFYFTSGKGKVDTKHSTNPVPLIVVDQNLKGQRVGQLSGSLSDVAPTILSLMHLPISPKMTGKNLLETKKEGVTANG